MMYMISSTLTRTPSSNSPTTFDIWEDAHLIQIQELHQEL